MNYKKFLLQFLLLVFFANFSFSQDYLFFTNSDNSNYYDYSYLYNNAPSTLLKINTSKYPVSVDTFYSSSNSLKLQWKSVSGGDWGSAIAAPGWPGRDVTLMDSLSIWVFSDHSIPSLSLPKIYLEDLSNQKTLKINLSDFYGEISAGIWTNIKIPISVFIANPGSADLTRIKVIYFGQGIADNIQHTLFIDEVKITGTFNPNLFNHIVVLGSSTAAGVGPTSPDSAWVNRFRNYVLDLDSSFRVINLAVGGYTTYHIMPTGFVPPSGRPTPSINNNITFALTYNPVAILINMPSNDAANNYPINEQILNYDSLSSILNLNNIKFWISTTQPRNFSNQSQINLLFTMRDSTFSRYGEHAIDFWTDIAQSNGWINSIYNSGDGIHLNNAAHRILFERMRNAVVPVVLSADEIQYTNDEIDFRLNNNYPNPFNPTTNISFYINTKSFVKLDIFNLLGQKVANLIDVEKNAGQHSVTFSSVGLSSGVYIYRIFVSQPDGQNYSDSKKMLLMK